MQHIMKTAALGAAIALFSACGGSTAPATEEKTPQAAAANPAPEQSVTLKEDKLNAVFQQYLALRNDLVKGDADAAARAGLAIEAGAKELSNGGPLAAQAATIAGSSDLAVQRKAFAELSTQLLPLVKAAGVQGGKLYVDFCPMALNDKGAMWISDSEGIRNPYFGDQMLTCGEVQETLQ
ncbi:DUF3347 domain-containing protein [Chitinophaga lutea]